VLGVSTRSVRAYVHRGVLRGTHGQVQPGDVVRLERERRGRARHVVDRLGLRLAQVKTQFLRRLVGEITQAWDLGAGEINRDDLLSIYGVAQGCLKHGWPPGSAGTWAVIFSRLREDSLVVIQRATGDTEPYRPFCQLYLALSAEMRRECGTLVTDVVGRHVTKLASSWLERTVGRRALRAALRAEGGVPNRLLAREIRKRRIKE
jgi:hypothetical protein